MNRRAPQQWVRAARQLRAVEVFEPRDEPAHERNRIDPLRIGASMGGVTDGLDAPPCESLVRVHDGEVCWLSDDSGGRMQPALPEFHDELLDADACVFLVRDEAEDEIARQAACLRDRL